VKVADPQFDGVVIVTDSPSKLVGRNIPAKFGSNWSSGFGEEA
jgi:hypothetical protein